MTEVTRYTTTAQQPGTGVAVTTSSTSVVAANPDRYEVYVINDSDTIVYLRLASSGAVVNQGIRLNAAGGSFYSEFYNGAISAIHGGSGSKTITVVEV